MSCNKFLIIIYIKAKQGWEIIMANKRIKENKVTFLIIYFTSMKCTTKKQRLQFGNKAD